VCPCTSTGPARCACAQARPRLCAANDFGRSRADTAEMDRCKE
jgi:hypothetical protein